MKRAVILLSALVLCLCFFSCKEAEYTEDCVQLYTKAKEKTDSLTSFDAVMDVSFVINSAGKESGNVSRVSTRVDNSDPLAPVYISEYSVRDLEIDHEYKSSSYYADLMMYEALSTGEKYKVPVSVESVKGKFSSVAMEFPASAFEKSKLEGNKVSAKTTEDKLGGLLDSFLYGMEERFTPINGSFDYDYSEVDLSFTTNADGYFTQMSVSCSISFDHAEGSATVELSQTITFNNPGEAVKVTAPADLDQYTLYEEQELSQEEMEEQFMNEIFALFIFDDGTVTRVENFDTLYANLCAKYGKEAVDSYVETIEMMGMIGGME